MHRSIFLINSILFVHSVNPAVGRGVKLTRISTDIVFMTVVHPQALVNNCHP